MSNGQLSPDSKELLETISNTQPSPQLRRYRVRRQSMEQLDLLKVVCACLCLVLLFIMFYVIIIH